MGLEPAKKERITMPGEPGAAILEIFGQLIETIKSNQPIRTDGKSLASGFVYSQMVLGMPVDPRDYNNPWSPMGGSTLQEAVAAPGAAPAAGGTTPAAGGTAPAAGGATPAAGATKLAADPKYARAMEAAFKTSQLVDHAIMVTNDDSFHEYNSPRHISFAYENIINGMQPTPMPPIAPEVQKQIDDAKKILYEMDEEGNIVGKSKLYKNYVANSTAYAKAKKDYADAQAAALADPTKADIWPQDSVYYQNLVDTAWDTFKTEGAEQIERSLDIIESVGVSMQDRMIAKSRKIYDAWNLGLAGVPIAVPYSYISPSAWSDPTSDDDGWQHLHVEQSTYNSHDHSHTDYHGESHGKSDSSSTSGSVGFWIFSAEASYSDASQSFNSSWKQNNESDFQNDATSLIIDLEYALCTIERPWLLGDLFYMKNWYMVNNPKNAISDGTVDGQAGKEDSLMPMIPTQFLAIRNVTVKTDSWGSDGGTVSSYYGDSSSSSSSSSASGGGGVALGFVNFGGSHSESHAQSDSSDNSGSDADSRFHSHFEDNTLTIHGTQIIAWLSNIIPATAPLDDPGLKDSSTGASKDATASAPTDATTTTPASK
jgi:hypothetical protein